MACGYTTLLEKLDSQKIMRRASLILQRASFIFTALNIFSPPSPHIPPSQ